MRCLAKTKNGQRCKKVSLKGKKKCAIHLIKKGGSPINWSDSSIDLKAPVIDKLSDSEVAKLRLTGNRHTLEVINHIYETKYHNEFSRRTKKQDLIHTNLDIRMDEVKKRVPPECRDSHDHSWFYYYTCVKKKLSTLRLNDLLLFKLYIPIAMTSEDWNSVVLIIDQKTSVFPKEMWNLTQLTNLYIRNKELKSIPHEIINLTKLQHLNLMNNKLKSIPREILNLTHLTGLNISKNKLTTLPQEIGNLTRLQWLSLNYNKFTTFPQEILSLTQLQRLYLSHNKLKSIPSEIGNFIRLEYLDLSHNKLTTLPQEIEDLQLENLFIDNNKFTTLPENLR